jgi:hypothetical protein
MMYAVYRQTDGVVIKHVSCPPSQLAINVPSDCAAVAVTEPVDTAQRIDPETQERVDHRPPSPGVEYEFRAQMPAAVGRAAQRWRWVKTEAAEQRDRAEADARRALDELERANARTLREAVLGDAAAIERLRLADAQAATYRATIQRVISERDAARGLGNAP